MVLVRDSRREDVPTITRIYAHWVEHGLGTFELEPPGVEEMSARREAVLAGGFPYLVSTDDAGAVTGYAYAAPYRTRPAYRFTVEDSIYLAPEGTGKGIGRALLEALIARCEAASCRQMIAVIGDSGNAPSIKLHTALGFRHAGVLRSVGWKHGRWVDCVMMIRPLGPGDTTPPA